MNVQPTIFSIQTSVALGALGAALLGGVFALEFDRLIAIADHLMDPAGQKALVDAVGIAALAALLACAAAMLTTRSIRRGVVRPFLVLTEQLEGSAERGAQDVLQDPGHIPAVHRMARAVLTIQAEAATAQQATAELRIRYDALCEANARERQTLIVALLETAKGRPDLPAPAQPLPDPPALLVHSDGASLCIPAPPRPPALLAPLVAEDLFGPMRLSFGYVHTTAH